MSVELLNRQEFERFRGLIYRESGIRIGDGKVSLLSNRIRKRLKACNLADFGEYFRFLTSGHSAEELQYFLDAITTNETFFFRTPAHFAWLRDQFIPDAIAEHRKGLRPAALRFWSAACASGAEAWSIAFCLADNRFRLKDWSLQVLGTDISEHEINRAREADYPNRMLENLSPVQQRSYFLKDGKDHWSVRPRFRPYVDFARANLMLPLDEEPFDCVFLCNVLIYFDRDSKQRVLENVTNALAPGGFLVTGPSEGVFDLLGSYRKVAQLVYRKVPANGNAHPIDQSQECSQ